MERLPGPAGLLSGASFRRNFVPTMQPANRRHNFPPLLPGPSTAIRGTTIDELKLEHFDGLAENWWDESPSSPTEVLHKFNAFRVPYILSGLESSGQISRQAVKSSQPLKNLKILEVGCGGGILAESLGKLGGTVLGLDPSETMLTIANNHLPETLKGNVQYKCCTAELLGEDHFGQYDVITLSEVLEHVNDPKMVIEACARLLKPKGSIFISTPNRSWSSWFFLVVMMEKVLRWVPDGTHSYDKFLRPKEVMTMLNKNFIAADWSSVRSYEFNFLTREMKWVDSVSDAYFIQGVKGK